ncbi:MAG: MATE family efflux transporter [Clostridiales bacterium]|nr:MATE family efflux transporter [Clostridiales bacterium]
MADISYIQEGRVGTFSQQLGLAVKLAMPAILAQLSSIVMQYIDASMVGRLGTDPAAAIGLVSTSLWLFWGTCSAITMGFSVLVAHRVGAKDYEGARDILRQSITATIIFSLVITAIGVMIAPSLPRWLGGESEINGMASHYFMIFVMALPMLSLNYLAGGMLRCAGNMKVPSLLNIMMCLLDVVFNFLLIFDTRQLSVGSVNFTMPGAGLGVEGAALGTVLAEIVTACSMLYYLCCHERGLALKGTQGSFKPVKSLIYKALRISTPMTVEHAVICGAQVMITVIVAPLGPVAIAANAFAITAESLCYMPGYGIGDAATTLVGQSHGANNRWLVRRFGYITVGLGMAVMTVMGLILYFTAPLMMELMTPVASIQQLGAEVLRIEAWAEPMFAASIVAYGVFVGKGDTIVPACMNFGSIWLVRVPLAAWLSGYYASVEPGSGLKGVWVAMAIELTFRGAIFLIRLFRGRWNR